MEEFECPVGTFRDTVGAGAVTDCAPCTAGYYCQAGSTNVTGSCDKGYYCPTNFANPYGNDPPNIGSYGSQQVSTVQLFHVDSFTDTWVR